MIYAWLPMIYWIGIVNNCNNLVIFPLRQIISLRVVFPFWIDIIYLCALQTTKLILAYNSCLFRYESLTGMGLKIDDAVCPMWKLQFQHRSRCPSRRPLRVGQPLLHPLPHLRQHPDRQLRSWEDYLGETNWTPCTMSFGLGDLPPGFLLSFL